MACGEDRSPIAPAPPPAASSDPLKAAAAGVGRLVGTAVQAGLLVDPQYNAVVSGEFSYLTAEYQMKWNVIEPVRGGRDFGPGDAIAGYAAAQGMRLKGHTLLWHGATPSWVNALTADDLRTAVDQHIRTVAGHYRGRVHAWDVVNEAVADGGGSLRDTVFRQKLGDRYIADAFRLARETDPGALLFYNDYGGEGGTAKADRIYTLLQDLLLRAYRSTASGFRCTSPRSAVLLTQPSPRTCAASPASASSCTSARWTSAWTTAEAAIKCACRRSAPPIMTSYGSV